MFSIIHKNNFLRTLISGSILMLIVYWLMSFFAPLINQLAIGAGMVESGAVMGISAGMNPAGGLMNLVIRVVGGNLGGILMLVVAAIVYVLATVYTKKAYAADEAKVEAVK